MNTTELRATLEERIGAMDPPAGDLERVRRAGRSIRTRRRVVGAVGVAALIGAIGAAGSQVPGLVSQAPEAPEAGEYASLGPLDFSDGARAYADPGTTIHLGGRAFPAERLGYLDTDGAATSHGVVFFDDGRPMILGPDGDVVALVEGPVDSDRDFHPTAKADSQGPRVAWATLRDGTATIVVQDLVSRAVVASTEVDCGDCDDLVIDALDGGVVFVRTADGIRTWDSASDEWSDFAGPETRLADVRNGVVLHDGPQPTAGGWKFVEGAIDAQLTLDGRHVLHWSSRLEPTDPEGVPVELEVPRGTGKDNALAFYAVDTDGSILVAWLAKRYPNFTVSDCDIPSGSCVDIGRLETSSGDPAFIGVDM